MYAIMCLLRWWQVPYYWVGIKAYDLVAGSKTVKSSYYVNKENTLELFPMLRGDRLCGSIVYYDGNMNKYIQHLDVIPNLFVEAIRFGNQKIGLKIKSRFFHSLKPKSRIKSKNYPIRIR